MIRVVTFLALAALTMVSARAEPERLPDGLVTKGKGEIAEVWLTLPTTRYRHAVLGDAIEAGGLALRTRDGKLVEHRLGERFVFEDRKIRLADLNGDGRDEMLAVLSHHNFGAALAVYGLTSDNIKLLARTPFIGTANRWLNPAGIADFDGDGQNEVAIVVTPHLAGRLQIWKWRDGGLVKLAETTGLSNHIIGERELDRSAVVTLADGRKGLVIETLGHDELVLLALESGKLKELARHAAGGRLQPGLTASPDGRQVNYRTGGKRKRIWKFLP